MEQLFSDKEIDDLQRTITRYYCKILRANQWLFGDKDSYFHFVFGCVGLGIARALNQKERCNEESGSFYLFCCMKSHETLRDEMQKEHRRLKSSSQAVLKELYFQRPQTLVSTKDSDARDLQNRVLSELPPDQRDVLILIDYWGCPAKEAAMILKRSVDAVYSLLKRARRNARQRYEKHEKREPKEPKPPLRDRDVGASPPNPRRPRDGLSGDSRVG